MFFFNVLSIVRLQWELFIHTPRLGAPGGMDRGETREGCEQAKISPLVICALKILSYLVLKEKCCTLLI